ncbi:hypothetical protein MHB50_11330 [Siminovitchia sp. FSL H7-0308]|uniref:Uncharacterized protein n=1 Tax=Siminovitchia thermophila TaxID=1245522 RepID=A0ABS2RC63_9BACI|nr:hypothetical protein [Siminovitchia thermophila]MBM7717250.1 hypothetical protein [Siminovitchia thermophila]ONK24357.1 hypothetical protein BLX87_05440 [Bacillus sp. VT-16-64]
MSEKLEQTKADYLSKLKQVKLAEAGVSITDVDIYTKYITGDSPEEIEKQAQAVAADIKREKSYTDVYVDDRSWRPFK